MHAILYESWSMKLHYACRFNSGDIAHKIFDIVEALVVATMAGHLSVTVADTTDFQNGHLKGFVTAKLVHQCLHLLRWGEIWFFSWKLSKPDEKLQMSDGGFHVDRNYRVLVHTRGMFTELFLGLLPLVAATFLVWWELEADLVIGLLMVSMTIQITYTLIRSCSVGCGHNWRKYHVAIHIEYCLHRYGEWTMLMLGEGVIQIILVPFDSSRYLTFFFSYVLIAALRVLCYSSQPFRAEGHALSRDFMRRGFFWLQLQPVISALIVCVGIGLKSMLLYHDYIDSNPVSNKYSWFLCISTSALLCLIWIGSMLHRSIKEEFGSRKSKIKTLQVLIYIMKFTLSLSVCALPLFSLTSFQVVMMCFLMCLFQIIFHDVWHRVAKENSVDSKELEDLPVAPGPDLSTFNPDFKQEQDIEAQEHPPLKEYLKKKLLLQEQKFMNSFRFGKATNASKRSLRSKVQENHALQHDLVVLLQKYSDLKLEEGLIEILESRREEKERRLSGEHIFKSSRSLNSRHMQSHRRVDQKSSEEMSVSSIASGCCCKSKRS